MKAQSLIDSLTIRNAYWQLKLYGVTPEKLRTWAGKIYSSEVIETAIQMYESEQEPKPIVVSINDIEFDNNGGCSSAG